MEKNPTFLGRGWSFPPVFDQKQNSVRMVSEEEDIAQSLFVLFATMPGERVTRPDFGCDLHSVLFQPMDAETEARIKELVDFAILYFEPRITLEEVEVDLSRDEEGIVFLHIHYTIRKTNTRTNIVYPFYKAEGTNVVEV